MKRCEEKLCYVYQCVFLFVYVCVSVGAVSLLHWVIERSDWTSLQAGSKKCDFSRARQFCQLLKTNIIIRLQRLCDDDSKSESNENPCKYKSSGICVDTKHMVAEEMSEMRICPHI